MLCCMSLPGLDTLLTCLRVAVERTPQLVKSVSKPYNHLYATKALVFENGVWPAEFDGSHVSESLTVRPGESEVEGCKGLPIRRSED